MGEKDSENKKEMVERRHLHVAGKRAGAGASVEVGQEDKAMNRGGGESREKVARDGGGVRGVQMEVADSTVRFWDESEVSEL